MIRRVYVDLLRHQVTEGRVAWLARALARYPLVRLSALTRRPLCGPILGTLVTNYTCNLRCRMCDMPARGAALSARGLHELDTGGMVALIDGFAALAAKNLRICDEIAVKSSGQFHRELHRLVVF